MKLKNRYCIITENVGGGERLIIEAGCDEAGRGSLAGPVFAAAVILPDDFDHPLLNDSKQLTEKQRDILRPIIEESAIDWAVSAVSAQEIDKINILNASILGMHKALDALKIRPEYIIVDGNKFKKYCNSGITIPHQCIIKGDGKFASIAAASILAKTHRDEYMRELAKEFPQYGWDRNMAYPTFSHREAIKKFGVTKYHRRSYKLLSEEKWQLF
ncbi:MAG: ribonuclease HII [Bacteroidales bacterium]|nr:ribonuclease HII [Bacteroidales bacterium]